MKYSSTHRYLNTVLFGLLTAGFVTLVVFFTFFWTPHSIDSQYLASVSFIDNGKSFAFNANLSVLAAACAFVSGFGLFYSIKSLINQKDDQLVVDSFLCFISLGYVAAIFFVLNAIWLYDLIGTGAVGFWIVLSIIGAIVALIAANVPMMKILEDDKTNRLATVIAVAFFAVAVGSLLTIGYSAIIGAVSKLSISWKRTYLFNFAGAALVASVLSGLAVKLYSKEGKTGAANCLTYASIIAFAYIPMYSGIAELVLEDAGDKKISLINKSAEFAGNTYCVMAIVTASILILGAIALMIASSVADKKEAK